MGGLFDNEEDTSDYPRMSEAEIAAMNDLLYQSGRPNMTSLYENPNPIDLEAMPEPASYLPPPANGAKAVNTGALGAETTSVANKRSGFLADLESKISALNSDIASKQAEQAKPDRLSDTQALGFGLSSALPILIGAALAGRKGALMGTAAAGVGGMEGLKIDAAKQADKDKILASSLSEAQHQRDALEGQKTSADLRFIAQDEVAARSEAYQAAAAERQARQQDAILKRMETLREDKLLPNEVNKQLSNLDIKRRNYDYLGSLVLKTKDNPLEGAALSDLSKQFAEEVQKTAMQSPTESFLADSIDSIATRLLAKSGLDPNSQAGVLFTEMARLGRANAIAQPGVATNQDVAQEVSNITIKPFETIDTYLSRLAAQKQSIDRSIDATLRPLELQGITKASALRASYLEPSSQGSSTSPLKSSPEIMPDSQGVKWEIVRDSTGKAIGKRRING